MTHLFSEVFLITESVSETERDRSTVELVETGGDHGADAAGGLPSLKAVRPNAFRLGELLEVGHCELAVHPRDSGERAEEICSL